MFFRAMLAHLRKLSRWEMIFLELCLPITSLNQGWLFHNTLPTISLNQGWLFRNELLTTNLNSVHSWGRSATAAQNLQTVNRVIRSSWLRYRNTFEFNCQLLKIEQHPPQVSKKPVREFLQTMRNSPLTTWTSFVSCCQHVHCNYLPPTSENRDRQSTYHSYYTIYNYTRASDIFHQILT